MADEDAGHAGRDDKSDGRAGGGAFGGAVGGASGETGDKSGGGPSGPGLTQGFEIAAGIGLGVLIGTWWDRHHGSSPWGLLIGLILGCVAGTYLLIKESMKANKN